MAMYDIAVIGGGPAGYVAAIKGAQLGGKVILFEKDVVGGTCLNRGCIPTKTYVMTAEYIEHIKGGAARGIINDPKTSVNMEQVVKYKAGVVKQLTDGVAALLRSNGVDVVKGVAKMVGETKIECNGTVYEAKNTILCGGSKAGIIPFPGVENKNVVTSDGILELTELPAKLVIIGGGVIGCEVATAFANFGSEVTIVEMMPRLVANMDEEISKGIEKSLKKMGVKVLCNYKVEEIKDEAGKTYVVANGEKLEASKILLSIGRVADLECLGTLADRIKQERGKVVVDEYMRTSIPNIYAPGDINGRIMLAHPAFKMGEAAAACCMGKNVKADLSKVPSCIYTLPGAASCGLTEAQAKEQYGADMMVGRFPFNGNGRALASGAGEGFVKVIAEKKYGEIVGVHMFGGDATEMISEASSLMAMEITVNEVADIIHSHPTFSEAFMEACADALGECIHLPAKKKK